MSLGILRQMRRRRLGPAPVPTLKTDVRELKHYKHLQRFGWGLLTASASYVAALSPGANAQPPRNPRPTRPQPSPHPQRSLKFTHRAGLREPLPRGRPSPRPQAPGGSHAGGGMVEAPPPLLCAHVLTCVGEILCGFGTPAFSHWSLICGNPLGWVDRLHGVMETLCTREPPYYLFSQWETGRCLWSFRIRCHPV